MKRIYVNQKAIERVKAGGPMEKVIVVHEGLNFHHCHAVEVNGPCRFVHDPNAQVGPTVWAETDADVVML